MRRFLSALAALALLSSTALAQSPGTNSPFGTQWSIPLDSIKRTYALSYVGLVPASAATDIWAICGSASATVRVTRITVNGSAGTAVAVPVSLIKRSTANTGGTIEAGAPFSGAAIVGYPYSSGFSAGTAKVTAWTANPTTGTAVGTISTQEPFLAATTALGSGAEFNFGNRPGSAVVLNGTAQCLAVNLNATTISSGSLNITTEWTEE